MCLLECLCRCTSISFWQMSINLQESVRLCILDVRTKWTSFKCLDSPLCRNSMQASSIAIKVLRRNVLGLLKAAMSSGWWRFEVVFQVSGFLFGLQILSISLSFIVGIITECPWVGCACFVCVWERERQYKKKVHVRTNIFEAKCALAQPNRMNWTGLPCWGQQLSNSPTQEAELHRGWLIDDISGFRSYKAVNSSLKMVSRNKTCMDNHYSYLAKCGYPLIWSTGLKGIAVLILCFELTN